MPREKITAPSTPVPSEYAVEGLATDVTEHLTEASVQVGWNKKIGDAVAVGVEWHYESPSQETGHSDSLWLELDRAGCNALIRLLRKARDATFDTDA